jgi:hydrogenase expression/formation protein HypE
MTTSPDLTPHCPIPLSRYPSVQLAHGGGGSLTRQLVEEMFLPAFENPLLHPLHDGATLPASGDRPLAMTTDSYVVRPLFFPGGDIGKMAVYGTVNDLAMCGAVPQYLTLGLIIEEGFPMTDLWRVISSIKEAAQRSGVHIVSGDTKVVDKGHGDGMYINTAGVGVIRHALDAARPIHPDDVILLSGDIGRHGITILAEREGLTFDSSIESDCAPLHGTVAKLLDGGITPHSLRDLTRGGLATALVELASSSNCEVHVHAESIGVNPEVHGACEMLGLDPLYVANEGCMIAVVPPEQADDALRILQTEHPNAARIGSAREAGRGCVTLLNDIGTARRLDLLSGEQLPRIC